MLDICIKEDEENSYLSGALDTLTEHTLGTCPHILGSHSDYLVNREIETRHRLWSCLNGIGSVLRQMRREHALTGIGMAIPYFPEYTLDSIPLSFKIIQRHQLCNPMGAGIEDRIYDGIEYDKNWDIAGIHVRDGVDTKFYAVEQMLLYHKKKRGELLPTPEIGPAICLYPSVRRILDAVVKSEEFAQSMPMAVELDGQYYMQGNNNQIPDSGFMVVHNWVPTLPPGGKLVHVPTQKANDRIEMMEFVACAAGRCLGQTRSIALYNTGNANMSASSNEIQLWEDKVQIHRFDFEPVVRKANKWWMDIAVLREDYLSYNARSRMNNFRYDLQYDYIFKHSDPSKNASARQTDLTTGSRGLFDILVEQGYNPRVYLEREAQLRGLRYEEYMKLLNQTTFPPPKVGVSN